MAKRFIDTNIFKKGFLKQLPASAKLFYIYLFCECDHYGIWNVEMDVAEVRLGISLDYQYTKDLLHGKIVELDGGKKWFMPDFINFQYGTLNPAHKLHKAVLKELERKDLLQFLTLAEVLPKTDARLKEKDMDMRKEREKDKEREREKESAGCESSEPQHWEAIEEASFRQQERVSSLDPENPTPAARKSRKTRENKAASGAESELTEYASFVGRYKEFVQGRGVPFRFSSTDGKAAKEILEYLANLETVKGGKKTALEVWEFILSSWEKLNQWTQTQIQLRQINSQLPNIIEQLRQTHGQQSKAANSNSVAQFAQSLRAVIKGNQTSAND